jgi:UDP-N-acetylmuramyl tripeptide synthase
MADAADDGPRHAFEDSRRLTGANRWFARTAVVLTALSSVAGEEAAGAAWAHRVRAMCCTLGWPDPRPLAHRHAGGTLLVFAAPEDMLFTATEVNEWAWEQAAGERARREGFEPAHALPAPAATFAKRAERERSRPLMRLKAAARERGVPICEDDDALTLGAGHASISYARAALPLPMDVPWTRLRDIPKALVTGSNGKTTTVRLLAAMAREAEHVVGLTSTEGVTVGSERMASGDYSGPAGARLVLRDPRVTLAVLETARGGIARRGLAVAQADVAMVTNISADHFGEYGVDGLDELAELKLVVARAVTGGGVLVLNADDALLIAAADRLPHAARAPRALFAADAAHPALAALRERGGSTCGATRGRLVLHHEGRDHDFGAVEAFPLTLDGSAAHNTMNLAGAALAAVAGLRLGVDAVRNVMRRFGSDVHDNPGRLERHAWRGATVLIDYAHNPDGLARLLAVARALPHRRLSLLLGQAGNRDDAAIAALARAAAAAAPDLVVIKDLPAMLRGRAPGEVPRLLRRALRTAGLSDAQLIDGGDEVEAARALLTTAQPGDMLVLPLHSAAGRVMATREFIIDPSRDLRT